MDQLLEQALDYARGMWRRRFLGVAVAWAVALAGIVAVFLVPNQYEASARLFVDTQSVLKPLMAGLTVQPNIERQVGVLSRTLLSRPNMEKLVRMADLDAGVTSDGARDALIDGVVHAIRLKSSPQDNLYWIVYRDSDPGQAKRVVEALLSIFVETGLGSKRRDTENAQQFLHVQIREYESKLARAERRLKEFKLKHLESVARGEDSIASMVALGTQVEQARTELRAAEEARDALRRQLEGEAPVFLPDPSAATGQAEDGATEFDQRLDALKKNLDELLRRYTDRHPDVVGTRRIIADLEQQREAKLEERRRRQQESGQAAQTPAVDRNPVYQQLKVSLADAEAKVAGLRARLGDSQARYAALQSTARLKPQLEEELGQLNRDYQVHKANYEGLVARRESALLTGELDQSAGVADFRIIDPPRVSPQPVAPDRHMLLGLVLALSLGGGVIASLVTSQMLPTFSSAKSLQQVTERPVLGLVSFQTTAAQVRAWRKRNYVFAGALGGLFAVYGSALLLLRMSTGG
jgi:polysaccharide chain length determinant protein (PEP-CTERM system associated)